MGRMSIKKVLENSDDRLGMLFQLPEKIIKINYVKDFTKIITYAILYSEYTRIVSDRPE